LTLRQKFGIASAKHTEQDRLGRVRRLLAVECFPNDLGADPVALDLDEIEWLAARGEFPEGVNVIGLHLPLDPVVALLHALLPGDFVLQVHGDGLCTIADGPDPDAGVEAAFGRDVCWSACPSTPAAIATLAGSEKRLILMPGSGLFLSGGSRSELAAQADRLDDQAKEYIAGLSRRPASVPVSAPVSGPPDVDAENLLASVRGLLSDPDRVMLALSDTGRIYAARPDLERLLATAGALELGTAAGGISLIRDPETARAALARPPEDETPAARDVGDERHAVLPARVGAMLIPAVGLVGVGRDEVEAGSHVRAAAHWLAVAATLLDNQPPAENRVSDGAPPEALAAVDHVFAVEAHGVGEGSCFGSLTGRAFIVTGAASGIGRDIARHLSSLGASLSLADVNGEALEAVADDLVCHGVRPLAVSGDLTDEAVVDRLVNLTVRRFGGLDGAVLNAGVALPGEIVKLSVADWRRSLEVNATSHFMLVKRLLPVLQAQGIGGSLVFIGSKNMFSPGAGFGAYSASKGALAQLARVVAVEGGPFGIRSNIVNPDNVFGGSQLWSPELRAQRAAVYGIHPEDLESYYTQRNLLKVSISGRDVAKGVAFLLSDDARRTTACVLTVDGGVPGVFPR
jgi:NAD(P)-dependent dehydrogenase (short-subunit alcohol dehydrogenase family)/rhamnose utilization protein RhaD (predicted bifunctional aldolase and dehydrogenase)